MNCTCETCKIPCTTRPGWFTFRSAERAAKSFKISFHQFVKKYLSLVACEMPEENRIIRGLAPKIIDNPKHYTGVLDKGTCIFFENGVCKVHSEKPLECWFFDHTIPNEILIAHKKKIIDSWDNKNAQQQIAQIYG